MSRRRKFLKQASMAALGSSLLSQGNAAPFLIFNRKTSPAEMIRFGTIGINDRLECAGRPAPTHAQLNLCDVDQSVLDKKMADSKTPRSRHQSQNLQDYKYWR
jgi:hypothetical protein